MAATTLSHTVSWSNNTRLSYSRTCHSAYLLYPPPQRHRPLPGPLDLNISTGRTIAREHFIASSHRSTLCHTTLPPPCNLSHSRPLYQSRDVTPYRASTSPSSPLRKVVTYRCCCTEYHSHNTINTYQHILHVAFFINTITTYPATTPRIIPTNHTTSHITTPFSPAPGSSSIRCCRFLRHLTLGHSVKSPSL